MNLVVAPVGDRAELFRELDGGWPEFMVKNPAGGLYYRYADTYWNDFSLLAVDRETGRAVAKAHSVPISWDGDIEAGLPEGGWDWVIGRSAHDRLSGTKPSIVSALEINIRPDLRGRGLSGLMLTAMRDHAAARGFRDLIAPVRPNGKPLKINDPIGEYAYATRPDGLPIDPWLRVHVRAGGRILNVAHHSMIFAGTLPEWRSWTGLPFDVSGPVEVPGALSPVLCDTNQNQAVYVEPNVWVHHRL